MPGRMMTGLRQHRAGQHHFRYGQHAFWQHQERFGICSRRHVGTTSASSGFDEGVEFCDLPQVEHIPASHCRRGSRTASRSNMLRMLCSVITVCYGSNAFRIRSSIPSTQLHALCNIARMRALPFSPCYGSNAFCIKRHACGMLPQPLCNTTGLDGGPPLANQRCRRPVAREGTKP